MNKLREIPAETLKTWAKYFEDGILQDEYGPELANLLNLLAADVEFHKQLANTWDEWYEGPIK
jgi:hypothetical protein